MALPVGTYPITITVTRANGATYTETSEIVIVDGVAILSFAPTNTRSSPQPITLNANNTPVPVVLDFVASETGSSPQVITVDANKSVLPVVLDFVATNTGSSLESIALDANNYTLAIISAPSGNHKIGQLVTVGIQGDGTETLSNPQGDITILANDGETLTFNAPDITTFGDGSPLFNEAVTYTLSNGSDSVTFVLIIEPNDNELYGQIASIHPAGVYADDIVSIGDYSHIKNITPGITINVADGSYTVANSGTADVALHDGFWSGYATETFEEPVSSPIYLSFEAANESCNAVPLIIPTTDNISITLGAAQDFNNANTLNLTTEALGEIVFGVAQESSSASVLGASVAKYLNFGEANESSSAGVMAIGMDLYFSLGQAEESSLSSVLNLSVFVPDQRVPVITLLGLAALEINEGGSYIEPGFSVNDDEYLDGSVIVTGSVNTSVPGTYLLRYNVIDSNNAAAAEVVRTIVVIAQPQMNIDNPLPSVIKVRYGSPYSISKHIFNPSGKPLTYTVAEGSVALNDGVNLNSQTGVLTHTGSDYATVNGILVEVLLAS